jgi:carbonic anhydrase
MSFTMKSNPILGALALAALLSSCASAPTMTKELQTSVTPQQALQKLKDGNQRFVSGRTATRDLNQQVKDTASGQFPFASVVSCLDSRTSTELIFDQGIGDVFNARVAGNIVNEDIIGSLEFASKAAGSKLIMVVGHTKCGAVMGACDKVELGNLTGLLNKIQPAVKATKSAAGEERGSKNLAFVDRVAESNVRQAVTHIRSKSSILRDMEKQGEVMIVGAMYDIETGKVQLLN